MDAAFLGDMTLRTAAGPLFNDLWAQICKSGDEVHTKGRGRRAMPRGDKGSYTDKQKRQAEHIEEGYEKKGVSKKEAEARAWATVNKETGGGKKSGSGRGKKTTRSASKKGGKKGGKKAAKKSGRKTSKKK
jgi:plasmid stabilization system protein ParE